MDKVFERGIAGATFGGLIGGAIGTALAGTAIATGGLAAIPIAFAVAVTSTEKGDAIGTIAGGTLGAGSAVVEKCKDNYMS